MGRKVTTEIFIKESRNLHDGKYTYEKTVFVSSRDNVTITCPIHGDFQQRASSHAQGNGCKKCQDDSRRMTTETFIKKARQIHGNRFDYSKADYKGSHKRVTIICLLHGEFTPLAYLHLQKKGCSICKYLNHPGGYTYELFDRDEELARSIGVFYIVEYQFDDETFIKIGITQHDAYVRHKSYWKNVEVLLERPMRLKEAFHYEQVLLHRKDLQPYRYTPKNLMAGVTDCFTVDVKPLLF